MIKEIFYGLAVDIKMFSCKLSGHKKIYNVLPGDTKWWCERCWKKSNKNYDKE